jgi:hypothetical protein
MIYNYSLKQFSTRCTSKKMYVTFILVELMHIMDIFCSPVLVKETHFRSWLCNCHQLKVQNLLCWAH